MQYNLIRNGYFTSLTASGTGNVDLTWAELEFLMDGNLTSSGVSITSSGVLYLETDLSQRIKVDGIRLYTGDLSKSANIKFYYKNAESDSYTIITTHSGASYYYATMDSPSAPQFIRVTVSGVDMDIYEFQVFNDDYIVSFGQDGSQYAEYLDNTPVGEIGAVESIAIYNNSTSPMPANAYTCIDYTGNIGDNYIEIGASSEGPFYSLSDGVLLEDNLSTSKYIWNAGEFSSTEIVDGHTLQNNFSDPAVSGTYISPIFMVDEVDKASYFIIDGETDPATGSISCDSSVYNGTIQHRATNTEPLHDRRILWSTSNHDSHLDVRYLYSNTSSYSVYTTVHNNTTSYVFPAVNRWNGLIAICNQTYTGYPGYLDIVNPSNYAKISSYSAYEIGGGSTATWAVAYSANIKLEFDIENGLWGYGNTGYYNDLFGRVLFHMRPDHHYASYLHYEGGSSRIDFLYDLAVVSNGTDAWYTHKIDNVLKRISTSGNTMVTINGLVEPRAVCASHEDNGCWVWDTNLTLLYQYSEEGEVLKTLSASELGLNKAEIWRLDRDFDEGIWLINSEGVGHINEYDKIDLFIEKSNLSRIRPGHKCCAVYSYYEDYVAFVDLKEGSTTSLWTTGSTATHPPALMDVSYEDLLQSGDPYNLIPVSYDPVWNNSFDWTEVPKDGYFLPKLKYHQVKLTLWGDAKVNKIIMAPPVKLEDIQPLSYRNLYIRTNIPVGTDVASYETKLKTWWGVQE